MCNIFFPDGSSAGGSSVHDESGINFLSSTTTRVQSPISNINTSQLQFKSPNVVCPSDSVVPKVCSNPTTANNVISGSSKSFTGPFPFASMNQAIHGGNRECTFNQLPPPYPGKHPPVTISSPLLVNLLQNDVSKDSVMNIKHQQQQQQHQRGIQSSSTTLHQKSMKIPATVTSMSSSFNKSSNAHGTQTDVVLASESESPSALLSNTSVKKPDSTLSTSTSNKTANKSPFSTTLQYRGVVTPLVSNNIYVFQFELKQI